MQVALYRSQNNLADHRNTVFGQQRFQKVQPGIHRPGRQQNMRQEDFMLFELLADHCHSRQQAVIEYLLRTHILIDRLPGQLSNALGITLLKFLYELLNNTHRILPPIVMSLIIVARVALAAPGIHAFGTGRRTGNHRRGQRCQSHPPPARH